MRHSLLSMMIILLLLSSCRFLDELKHMSPPELTAWTPGEGEIKKEQLSEIVLTFSAVMDRNQTESAFTLNENDESLQGTFYWEDTVMSFTPYGGFKDDAVYTIALTKTAEDKYGNSLNNDWNGRFTTGADQVSPRILSVNPPDFTAFSDLRQTVAYDFSESVEPQSFRDSFSISPVLPYSLKWSDDNSSVTVYPLENYGYDREYTLTIGTDLKDPAGNFLKQDHKTLYRIPKNLVPELTYFTLDSSGLDLVPAVISSLVEKNDTLRGGLNRPLKEEERLNLLSITPDTAFNLTWDSDFRNFTLSFTDLLAWEEYYDLEILDQTYILLANGPGSLPLRVKSVHFCPDSLVPAFVPLTLNGPLGAVDSSSALMDFLISHSGGSLINQFSFMEALSLDSSVLSFETRMLEIYDGSQIPAPAVLPSDGETLIRVHMDISDTGLPGILTLSLDDTLHDTLDNALIPSWSLTVNQP